MGKKSRAVPFAAPMPHGTVDYAVSSLRPEPGPDPDRVIEPEASRPEPSAEPLAGRATPPERRDGAADLAVPEAGLPAVSQVDGQVAEPSDSEVTPSWGSVARTTVRLWAQRRRRWWRVAAAVAAALIMFAAGGLTVVLVRTSGSATPAGGGGSAGAGLGAVRAAAAARQQAAGWVAAEVSHGAVVSCDPAMCAALQHRGFPAGDLMALGPAASDPLGSAVIVATETVRSEFGRRLTAVYAPVVIASFGSGTARVDVRVYAAGGAAAYLAALRADVRARRATGSELLRNPRVSAAPAVRQDLAAGLVDPRLLITIATLAGQGPVSIAAFGDSGPHASPGVPLRVAELASPPGAKSGYPRSVLAMLRAQQQPYLPESAAVVRLASGQRGVRIEFAAPSPLGLLSG
jgi:hypothetical protein